MNFKNFGSNQPPQAADGGKDFGSMNMDELLRNIWSAEETQTLASAGKDGIGAAWTNDNMPQRQQTLGEMTLEEFLARAGVVREDAQFSGKVNDVNGGFFDGFQQAGRGPNLMGNRVSEGGNQIGFQASNLPFNVNGVNSNHHHLAQQQTQHNHQKHRHPQPIFPKQTVVGFGSQLGSPGNRGGTTGIEEQELSNGLIQGGGLGMVGLGGPAGVPTGSPANQLASNGIGTSSADNSCISPVPYVFSGSLRGRKSGAVEKAYTMELEEEVAKLKEDNEELEKQNAELMEMKKNPVMETMNMQQGAKKRCLRRTATSPW
ncbi:Detected protein of unknown function [Hibiscus syriacus]|uniref:Uncharacterized protein n=1 Tax=Hibiscus syriacus TaxID=106335 RepID=A0A6A3BI12_HIBSY|nr:Detected protein of unknown function [Hibiscus syriacus]